MHTSKYRARSIKYNVPSTSISYHRYSCSGFYYSHSAPNPFTQASGAAKALAVAQTKGGTVWQDLSFCYINIVAPPVGSFCTSDLHPIPIDRYDCSTSVARLETR